MNKTFYHPHTILDSISDLDERWLSKQLDEKPFDIHFQYLSMLKNIDKDFESGVYRSIQKLRQLDPTIRIGHILQRITKESDIKLNSVSTVSIKSKKSDSIAATSIILSGLVEKLNHVEEFDLTGLDDIETVPSIVEEEAIPIETAESISDIDATSNTDTEEVVTESILSVDIINLEEEEEEESNSPSPKEDNSLLEVAAVAGVTGLAIESIGNEESEEIEEVEEIIEQEPEGEQILEEIIDEEPEIEVVTQVVQEEEEVPAVIETTSKETIASNNFTGWLNSLPNFHSKGNTQAAEPTVISEPLAQLLVKQGHKADAITMYNQLMQKFPEKSSFFADQIENLK